MLWRRRALQRDKDEVRSIGYVVHGTASELAIARTVNNTDGV